VSKYENFGDLKTTFEARERLKVLKFVELSVDLCQTVYPTDGWPQLYISMQVFISKINKYHVKVRRTLTDMEA